MRICKKDEFLNLPKGTFFCKGVRWIFSDLCVKGKTLDKDFEFINLYNMESKDPCELMERWENSLEIGESYEINKEYEKDNYAMDCQFFLVFEKEDIEFIKSLIENPNLI